MEGILHVMGNIRHRFFSKDLRLSRSFLRWFVSLCIVVLLGLFASFLDRVIRHCYISHSSPIRKVQQSQRNQLSDVEYPTYRLFNRALVRETIRKSQSHKFETRHLRLEQSGEDNKSPEELLDQERKLKLFKKDWCQLQRARLDWKGILSPSIACNIYQFKNLYLSF